MLKVGSAVLSEMIEHCRREFPNEACGYLIGRKGVATRAIAIENTDHSPTSYTMSGVEMVRLQKRLRQDDLEEMAIYHSHVATDAYPSRRDIDRATETRVGFDGHYVIVTLKDSIPRARAFRIQDGHVQEEGIEEE